MDDCIVEPWSNIRRSSPPLLLSGPLSRFTRGIGGRSPHGRYAARHIMQRVLRLCFFVALGSGCVTHKSCVVTTTPDHTEVTVAKTSRGLILGVGGFTTYAYEECTLRLPGQKVKYAGHEIQEVCDDPATNSYTGTISIFRNRKRVHVDLSLNDRAIDLNGMYHYLSLVVTNGRTQC
jgi:hypothetical protein